MISLATGCTAKDDTLSVEERLNRLFQSPYEAQCSAVVKSNKTENTYKYTCSKTADGLQKLNFGDMLITVSPDGGSVESNGENIRTASMEGETRLSPDYFFVNYQNKGKIDETPDGYKLECDASGDNPYRYKLVMETDKKLVPKKMFVEDKDGQIRVEIKIEKFLLQ